VKSKSGFEVGLVETGKNFVRKVRLKLSVNILRRVYISEAHTPTSIIVVAIGVVDNHNIEANFKFVNI